MAKNKLKVYMPERNIVVDIKVAPNQKVVEIHKKKLKSVIDIKFNRTAQATLSLAGYALYMHFMSNLHGYKEVLSVKNITSTTALSEKTYYKAVNELIEKKYLVREENKDIPNYYVLYEDPSLCVSPSPNSHSAKVDFVPDESQDEI